MKNKARYNVLDDKIVIIVTLPDKVRDRPLRRLRFCGRYSATADLWFCSNLLENLYTHVYKSRTRLQRQVF